VGRRREKRVGTQGCVKIIGLRRDRATLRHIEPASEQGCTWTRKGGLGCESLGARPDHDRDMWELAAIMLDVEGMVSHQGLCLALGIVSTSMYYQNGQIPHRSSILPSFLGCPKLQST
jgi:hypothetical protein